MDIEGVRISSKCPGYSHFVRRIMCDGMGGKDCFDSNQGGHLDSSVEVVS